MGTFSYDYSDHNIFLPFSLHGPIMQSFILFSINKHFKDIHSSIDLKYDMSFQFFNNHVWLNYLFFI